MSNEKKEGTVKERRRGHGWLRVGIVVSFTSWVLLYAVGNIIPSEIYRACFDPTVSIDPQRLPKYEAILARNLLPAVGVACLQVVKARHATGDARDEVASAPKPTHTAAIAFAMGGESAGSVVTDASPPGASAPPRPSEARDRYSFWAKFRILGWGAAAYPFVNVPVLAALAAFLGGCTSKLFWESNGRKKSYAIAVMAEQGAQAVQGADAKAEAKPGITTNRKRSHYLTESPFVSMARGFAVALAYTAGVGLIATVGGANPTPQDYTRYASFVSFLGFLVGYDADIFQSLLEKVGAKAPTTES